MPIHGDLNGTMAHLVFDIHRTSLEQEGGERMAEIMEAHLPNADACNNWKNRSRNQFSWKGLPLGARKISLPGPS